ncbi:MerR family transcriptional regulator [Neobacillus sp. SM06]|uniref:MerR family transcriptional regulator n=1 Tax=Neobacillus sp. SM06 TaxID=3422492 RepID=UPI003D29BB70
MKAYTLNEVSKKISVPPSKLKQWEKDLEGLLTIPRTKQGARFYTDSELELLFEIKELSQIHSKRHTIRELWQKKQVAKKQETVVELIPQPLETTSITVLPEELMEKEELDRHSEEFFAAMDTYKQTFLNEVKDEIRNVVRKEVVDEVKKEISNGMLHTVKSLSNSIYKSSATTQAELAELTDAVEKISEKTTETYQTISDRIAGQALETSEEIYTLSKQLSETSEELAHYIDATNNGIEILTETIEKERENYAEDLEQFRHEIRQREMAFQTMLSSFRETAPSRMKKWWQFW